MPNQIFIGFGNFDFPFRNYEPRREFSVIISIKLLTSVINDGEDIIKLINIMAIPRAISNVIINHPHLYLHFRFLKRYKSYRLLKIRKSIPSRIEI